MKRCLALLSFLSLAWLLTAGCGKSIESWEKQIVSEKSADQRREAILELMETDRRKSDEAVRLLAMIAREDEEPTVRSTAVQALARTDNPKAVEPLAEVLTEDTDSQVRIDAAVALEKVRGPEALRPLLARLRDDPEDQVRTACARTLGEYQYAGVVRVLSTAMLAEEFSVVFEARKSLEKLTGQSFQSGRAWHDWLEENGDPFEGKTEG